MSVPDDLKKELTIQAIDILLDVRTKITDHSDLMWTSFKTSEDFRADIDRCIAGIKNGDRDLLESAHTHFQPAFDFQEHAMENDWSDEYRQLAARFDKVYAQLGPLMLSP